MKKALLVTGLLLSSSIFVGCEALRGTRVPLISPSENPIVKERALRMRLMAFTDRYLSFIDQGADDLVAQALTPEERRLAHSAKYFPSLAMVSLAADTFPRLSLINMMTITRLERRVWEERLGPQFDGRAEMLMALQRRLEEDIWAIGASELRPSDITDLKAFVDAWFEDNPDVVYVSTVRLDDLVVYAEGRNMRLFEQVSIGNLLALPGNVAGQVTGIGGATAAVVDIQSIAERSLFVAQRAPLILSWQVEQTLFELAMQPEILGAQESIERALANTDEAVTFLNSLPEEITRQRTEAIQEIEATVARQRAEAIADIATAVAVERSEVFAELRDILIELQGGDADLTIAISATDSLLQQAEQTADSIMRMLQVVVSDEPRPEPSEPGRPFDIREYTEALTQMTAALAELNRAAVSTEKLLGSPAINRRLEDVESLAALQIRRITISALILIGAFWLGAGLWLWLKRKLAA